MATSVTLTVSPTLARYPQMVEDDEPYLYWRLGETAGTNADDLTANNRDGTYTGATLNQAGAINDGNPSASLDATTGRVKANASLTVNQGTMELWFFPTAFPVADATLATFNDADSTATVDKTMIFRSDGKVQFYVYDGNPKLTSVPTATVPLNQWVHVVGTVDSVIVRCYMNAVEVGTVGAVGSFIGFADSRFSVGYIGSNGVGAIARWAGRRDEAALYPYPLTPARIRQHYEAAFNPSLPELAMLPRTVN
jgi:hypothetical protein